jgi:hypothetical protein
MVNLVEEWEALEEYGKDKVGFYQILGSDKNIEVRVATGKIGFRKEFESATDPLLTRILEFCRKEGYIRINETVRDEAFFK